MGRRGREGEDGGIYNPGQAVEIFQFWPKEAQWFVIGGPADADEAQTVHARYPDVKCIGFEPNKWFRDEQRRRGFPGTLYGDALWDVDGVELVLERTKNNPRSGSVCTLDYEGEGGRVASMVTSSTLDTLSAQLGPFTNVVLWLDIEYAEVRALRGARKLFENGQILLVNVEVWNSTFDSIDEILTRHGLRLIHNWGRTVRDKRDVVYKLEK